MTFTQYFNFVPHLLPNTFPTQYLNLAIDFGAVIAFAVFAKLDLDKKAELDTNVENKLARKKEQNKIAKAMRQREENLKKLNLSIRVTADGDTQEATVGAIQGMFHKFTTHLCLILCPSHSSKTVLVSSLLFVT